MEFSATSVWTLTKLFVTNPGQASRLVLAANLPINVSVLMIALSGILSGVMAAVSVALFGVQSVILEMPDGTQQTIQQAPPIVIGFVSVLAGLGFSYLVYWVGVRSSGRGSLAQVMSVLAVLQIALTVLGVLTVIVDIFVPILGFALAIFVIYVSLRGFGNAVKESHKFETMGRAAMVMIAAAILAVFGLMIVMAMIGPSIFGVHK